MSDQKHTFREDSNFATSNLEGLVRARCRAYQRWRQWASEPGAWSDPQKRRRMFQARFAYQDATLLLHDRISGALPLPATSAPLPPGLIR